MSYVHSDKLDSKKPGVVRRKAIVTSYASQEGLVKIEPLGLYPESPLPLLIRPALDGVDLIAWATNHRELLEKYLLKHGGILFRNFSLPVRGCGTPLEDFAQFITRVSGDPLEYNERSSPRSQVHRNIYTSTDHPSEQSIFLHNENSYRQT